MGNLPIRESLGREQVVRDPGIRDRRNLIASSLELMAPSATLSIYSGYMCAWKGAIL